jgi:hypothetical protein
LLGTQAVAQQVGDAEVRFVDANNQSLPNDFMVMRGSDGNVLQPIAEAHGGYTLQGVGRKLTLEFTPKGLKNRSIDLTLQRAPKVYVTVLVNPDSGQIKQITQKPYYPNIAPNPKAKSGKLGIGGSQGAVVPPANNACATPLPITVGATAFDTTEATTDGPANGCGSGSQVHNDIWYDFTAPGNGTLTMSTCGTAAYDTVIAIYNGLTCPPAAPLSCNDDFAGCAGNTSQLSRAVVAGQHYLIRLGGFGTSSRGTGTLNLTFSGPPAFDECVGATTVVCNTTTTVSSTSATQNGTDPAFSCRFGGPGAGFGTIWFKFVATGPAATLDLSASAVSDTMMAVYSGTCGALTEIACDDDSGTGLRSLINVGGLTAGTTYFVQVGGFGASDVGSITLDLDCAAGPPPGDACADAITVACGATAVVDNTLFTTEPLDPAFSCRFGGPGQGVGNAWFKFVATATSARLNTNASLAFDTLLAVYSGTCGAFTELACSDDEGLGLLSELCVTGLTIGQTYYVQVGSFSSFDTGEITLEIECPCPAPPANDDCANAEVIASLPASATFDNSLAVDDIAVPCGVASGPFKNVWYRVAGTGNTMTATTCNGGTLVSDTKISVFCGDCLALTCVGGNDDDCPSGGPGFSSTVEWCSQVGATYFITVGNFSASTVPGQIQLDVSDGGSCTPVVQCLPTGACCLSDGTCVTTTSDDCAAQGGTYSGDGTSCTTDLIADGSFEGGTPSASWTEASTNFGTPICDPFFCGFGGGTGPRTGDFWAWFGGVPALEIGSVEQSVVIPTGATTLDFFLEIPVSSGNGTDFMRVKIDGTTVFSVLEGQAPYAGIGYEPVSIPLGGFADGGAHTIRFESTQSGSPGITNFFVDDISMTIQTVDCIQCYTLDFGTEDDFVTPLVNGQEIDTEFGNLVTITGSGANRGPAIFLSSNPGPNNPSQDLDLLVQRGNLLILQNDAATNPPAVGGVFPRPNDDENGGTLTFDFLSEVEPQSIVMVDIDDSLGGSATVVLTDSSARTRTYSVPAGWTEDLVNDGPTGWRTLNLTTLANQPGFAATATASEDAGFDGSAVVRITVALAASGAVDDLSWCE